MSGALGFVSSWRLICHTHRSKHTLMRCAPQFIFLCCFWIFQSFIVSWGESLSPVCEHVHRCAAFFFFLPPSKYLFSLRGLLNRHGGTSADAPFQLLISLIFCLLIKCSVCVRALQTPLHSFHLDCFFMEQRGALL